MIADHTIPVKERNLFARISKHTSDQMYCLIDAINRFTFKYLYIFIGYYMQLNFTI